MTCTQRIRPTSITHSLSHPTLASDRNTLIASCSWRGKGGHRQRLEELEKVAFDHYEPAFWRRYVDDKFVIIERSRLADFQDLLNGIFPDIQFTREEEHDEQLPFLDVLVTRTPNGELNTTVYRKATNTTQILNYHSNHPMAHKRSCVRTLFQRVKRTAVNPRDEYENFGIFGTNWQGLDTRKASSAAASARAHGEQTEESRQHSGTLYHT
ncbi:Acyl-CoA synthetase member 2 mitochondrial [Sparganum proliferum]